MREDTEAIGSVSAGIIARLAPDDDPEDIAAWLVAEYGSLDGIDPVRFACDDGRQEEAVVQAIQARAQEPSEALVRGAHIGSSDG